MRFGRHQRPFCSRETPSELCAWSMWSRPIAGSLLLAALTELDAPDRRLSLVGMFSSVLSFDALLASHSVFTQTPIDASNGPTLASLPRTRRLNAPELRREPRAKLGPPAMSWTWEPRAMVCASLFARYETGPCHVNTRPPAARAPGSGKRRTQQPQPAGCAAKAWRERVGARLGCSGAAARRDTCDGGCADQHSCSSGPAFRARAWLQKLRHGPHRPEGPAIFALIVVDRHSVPHASKRPAR